MKYFLLLLGLLGWTFYPSYAQSQCPEVTASSYRELTKGGIFISQIIDGPGNNKCVEIFNASDRTVDLGQEGYSFQVYQGYTFSNLGPFDWDNQTVFAVDLVGTLKPGDVHVICNAGISSAVSISDYQSVFGLRFNVSNGFGAVALATKDRIQDVLGVPGCASGEWNVASNGITPVNRNLIRKESVVTGIKSFDTYTEYYDCEFLPLATEWYMFNGTIYDGLGTHDCDRYGILTSCPTNSNGRAFEFQVNDGKYITSGMSVQWYIGDNPNFNPSSQGTLFATTSVPGNISSSYTGTVMINEVMVNARPGCDGGFPQRSKFNGEFIEIKGEPGTDIGGWVVTDGQKDINDFAIRIPDGTLIPEKGLYVIARSGSPCAPDNIDLDVSTCDCAFWKSSGGQLSTSSGQYNLTNEGEYVAILDYTGSLVHAISWGDPQTSNNLPQYAGNSPVQVKDLLGNTLSFTISPPQTEPAKWVDTYLSPKYNNLEDRSIESVLDAQSNPDWVINTIKPLGGTPGKDNMTGLGFPLTGIYYATSTDKGLKYVKGVITGSGGCTQTMTEEFVLDMSPDFMLAYDPSVPGVYKCNSVGGVEDEGPYTVDDNLNWVKTTIYGDNPNGGLVKIGQSVQYMDKMMRPIQKQYRNMQGESTGGSVTETYVVASQIIYDAFGRPSLNTFQAPINNQCGFEYDANFIRDASTGGAYDYVDFDDFTQTGTSNTRENPVAVRNTSTLGRYYSSSNNQEENVAETAYPYVRSTVSQHGVARSGGPGHVMRMGNGHESMQVNMLVQDELNHYIQFRDDVVSGISPATSGLKNKATKKIFRSPEGQEMVSFYNLSGNLIASALSGDGQPVTRIPGTSGSNRSTAYTDLDLHYVDVHISPDLLNVSWTGASGATVNIYDMITDIMIYNGTASGFTSFTSGGFYRIVQMDGLGTSVGLRYQSNYYDFTYYYYDLAGRMIAEVQPEGVDLSSDNFANALDANQTSRLNHHGWYILDSESPDEGKIETVFREDGTPRFSQDAKQAAVGEYSYFVYEESSDRVLEIGVVRPGVGEKTFESHQASGQNSGTVFDIVENYGQTGLPSFRYDQTYYKYDLPDDELQNVLSNTPWLAAHASEYRQTFLLGLVSSSYNQDSRRWYSYDARGRMLWSIQKVNGVGVFTVEYEYDFQGNLKEEIHNRYRPEEYSAHKFEYDRNDRMYSAFFTNGEGKVYIRQAHYEYYKHGGLKREELGPYCSPVQGIDYIYNHEGKLKAINTPSYSAAADPGQDGHTSGPHQDFAQDVFGMALDYYQGDYAGDAQVNATYTFDQHYNGLIGSVRWKNKGQPHPVSYQDVYRYSYDHKNQLTQAQKGTLSPTTLALVDEYKVFNLSYDRNGNIQTLSRNANFRQASPTLITREMDRLTYQYDPNLPNRLTHVTDAFTANHQPDGKGDAGDLITQSPNHYQYNEIGELDREGDVKYTYDTYGNITSVRKIIDEGLPTEKEDELLAMVYDENGARILKTTYQPEQTMDLIVTEDVTLSNINGYSPDPSLDQLEVFFGPFNGVVAWDAKAFMKFDFSSIPANAIITQADLVLHSSEQSGGAAPSGSHTPGSGRGHIPGPLDIRVTGITEAWNASSANYPGPDATNPEPMIVLGGPSSVNQTYTISVLDILAYMRSNPSVNYEGLRISSNTAMTTATDGLLRFYSAEGPTNLRPQIRITYKLIDSKTFYSRDAAGNVLSIYEQQYDANGGAMLGSGQGSGSILEPQGDWVQQEVPIYGMGRLGMYNRAENDGRIQANIVYELSDHLGNVRAVVRGIKNGSGEAIILDFADYFPFGSPLPNRRLDNNYRYTYQGIEEDDFTGWNLFALRHYDARLGRFANPDPYNQFYSPYLAMGNNPISMIDPSGGFSFNIDPIGAIASGLEGLGWLLEKGGGGGNLWATDGYPIAAGTITYHKITKEVKVTEKISYHVTGWYTTADLFTDLGAFVRENRQLIEDLSLDGLQIGLGFLGSSEIPLLSQVGDGLDGLVSLGRGDVIGAGMSFGGAAAPGLSQLKLAKTGTRAAKNFNKLLDAYRAFKKGCKCFAGEQEVLTDDGLKEIEDVEAGNHIWVLEESDDGTFKLVPKAVDAKGSSEDATSTAEEEKEPESTKENTEEDK
ncbi:MAG: DNRLRE domain-containing protein [Bacteroidota bacterium]